jgi:hypothetical protein
MTFETHQSIDLWIIDKKWFSVPLLVLHERLDVHVEVLRVGTFGGLRGLLAPLEQQSQQREQGVSEINLVFSKKWIKG